MRLTIDSYAWIELINGSPLGVTARERILSAEACFVPSIVLAEVGLKLKRNGWADSAIRGELDAMTETAEVVPIVPDLSILSAEATLELRLWAKTRRLSAPGLGDGLVLATAWQTESSVLTGDEHFHDFGETVWLGQSSV